MRNHGALLCLIVLTSLVTDWLSAFWDRTALSAAKCITKPNRQTPPLATGIIKPIPLVTVNAGTLARRPRLRNRRPLQS